MDTITLIDISSKNIWNYDETPPPKCIVLSIDIS
jgi:hypothetical protein